MNKIIYVSSQKSQQIHVLSMNQHGYLKLVQILTIPNQISPIIIHPNKKFLYAGTRPIPKIIIFYIEKNGYLRQIGDFSISSYSTHLTINITGTTLYSVSYNDNSLDVIQLNNLGNCVSIPQTLTGLMGCHSSKIETTKNRLWIPCLKEDSIRLYNIYKTGILDNNSLQKINTKTYSGPRHMVFDYLYNYAYLINELNSTVNVIKIHMKTNILPTITQIISIIPENYYINNNICKHWASDIHITPNNRWIYCSDRYTNIISYLEILNFNNNKRLKFKGFQPTEIQPRGFTIDHQGQHLFVAGQKSNFISIYKINEETGTLHQLSRSPTGEGPIWIAILN